MVTTPLRARMRQALRIRNMSPRTERTYLDNVARFALYFHLSPDRLGLPQIEQYLFFLRDVKKVSYCWFNQCVCALRFFYLYVLDRPDLVLRIPYGRRERHLPVVLSAEELLALLAAIGSFRDRVLLTVLYSAGIRLGEVCRLRVDDIDSPRMLLRIRQGKGHKDRFAPLSPIALELLRQWWIDCCLSLCQRPRSDLLWAPMPHSAQSSAPRVASSSRSTRPHRPSAG